MNYKLNIATPAVFAAINGVERFEEFSGDGVVTALSVLASEDTDGNPDWGMPFETTVTVTLAAERWHGSMDDDGPGEPVTDVADLAALLGCEPDATEVARVVYDRVTG